MNYDAHFADRIRWLAELMIISPYKPMKKLQREALKLYPLYHKEANRHWLSWRTAFQASDVLERLLAEREQTYVEAIEEAKQCRKNMSISRRIGLGCQRQT